MARRPHLVARIGLVFFLGAPLACNNDKELSPEELAAKLEHDIAAADTRLRNNKLDDAEKLLVNVLELAPDHPDAVAAMGRVRYEQKNYEQAEALFKQALAKQDDDATTHGLLGKVYALNDRHTEAAAAFGRASELAPEDSQYGLAHGQQLLLAKQYAPAEAVLAKVAEIDPMALDDNGTGVHTLLADAVRAQDRPDEALKLYMKAQSTYASDKMARAGAAFIYEAKDDIKHALDEWSGYIRMDCCSEYSNDVAKKKVMELGGEPTDDEDEQAAAVEAASDKAG
jgi:tetratricopeptide (TPR) repeat protein